jgi:hypothetical protein
VVADLGTGTADEHGKPLPRRASIERLFGITRQAVARRIEPSPLAVSAAGEPAVPRGLRLAGRDTITAAAGSVAAYPDQMSALAVHRIGKGKAVYLNGMLGYNMPSRRLLRDLLAAADVSTPVRVTSGGDEKMGYEWTTFRRGDLEVVGILRLRDETEPTRVKLGRTSHLYDVRNRRYLGCTDTAQFDLTQKAAAVLAAVPYRITGVEARVTPGEVTPGGPVSIMARVQGAASPGDHVLRIEVYDPAGRLSRAYTGNFLAAGGQFQRVLHTALNDPSGRWRLVVTEVFSGQRAETEFRLGDRSANP